MDVLDASRHSSLTVVSFLVHRSLALALVRHSFLIIRIIPAMDMAATGLTTRNLLLRAMTTVTIAGTATIRPSYQQMFRTFLTKLPICALM